MNLKHWFGRLLAFLFLFQLFLLFFHPLGTECQPVPDGRSCWTFFPAIRTYLFNMLFAVGAGQVTFWPGICHSFMQALYPSLVLSLFQTFITHCSILMYLFNLIFIVFFPLPFKSPYTSSCQQSPHCCPCPWVFFSFCSVLPLLRLSLPPSPPSPGSGTALCGMVEKVLYYMGILSVDFEFWLCSLYLSEPHILICKTG